MSENEFIFDFILINFRKPSIQLIIVKVANLSSSIQLRSHI